MVEVPAESPARLSDLRVDDRIVAVDGKPIEGLSSEAVHDLLSGQVGSTANLEVLRGSERLTLHILREPYESKGAGN